MGHSWIRVLLASSALSGMLATGAFAHPASGIAVNAAGEILFVHTGRGLCKIDTQGKLTYLHKDTGGHWLAVDTEGSFSSAAYNRLFDRVTPAGTKPTLLYTSGGAPLVVSRDRNLYYGSGYPEGDDMAPGGHTLTRLTPDGKRSLFSPALKSKLAAMNEAITGLATGPEGTLFVACPNAILKVKMDGSVSTFLHPVVVQDRADDLAKDSRTRFFHSPYLRGLHVNDEGTVYAAVTGARCVVKISRDGKLETLLKSEQPWTPTGVTVGGKDIFVLEYSDPDKPTGWRPRVRKLSADGRVSVLMTGASPESKRKP